MKIHRAERFTFLLIALVTAAALALWLVLLFCLWAILTVVGLPVDFWAMTEALSTAVAAATVLGAGYVAYRELNELAAARHIEVADKLFEELNSPENTEARRWIFRNLPDDPEEGIPSLSSEGRIAVKRVLNSLDRVAFLTQSGWIPEEVIMPWMNPMVVKAWVKLESYVDYESQRRHEPDYYEQARELAERCVEWRRKNLPDADVTWVDDAL